MSKRKLSKKQAWRIKKIQEERASRLSKRAQSDAEALESGELGPEEKGLVIAHYGASVDIMPLSAEQTERPVYRCKLRTNLDDIVTGDEVVWRTGSDQTGVIVANLPRRSELQRPDRKGRLKPMAANIDFIIIVLAPRPQPTHLMIDRYLIAAELSGIEPILLLNKSDLLDDYAVDSLDLVHQLELYEELGFRVLHSSTKTDHGLDALLELLHDSVSVFVGQSGVGKSSLVNVILPKENARVGEISEQTGFGRHTTTTSKLYHLPRGGQLIDSPGIREFGLWHLDPSQVIEGMREFAPYLGHCKFRNCQHEAEPGCAIRAAVEAGKIKASRFENFRLIRDGILAEMEN